MRPLILAAAVHWGIVWSLAAADPAEVRPGEATESPNRPVAEWVRRLGAEAYQDRDEATRELIRAGRTAIEPVAEAAESGSLEVAARCLTILGILYTSPDEPTRDASRAALEKLAGSKNASVSRRARDIVTPPAANPPPGLPLGGGRIQMKSRMANGRTEVEVDENGTKVRITHDAGRAITVIITLPQKNGGPAPDETKVEAADAAELKKKNPEAARFYEQYGTGRPRAGAFGAAPFGPGPFVNRFPQFPGPPVMPGPPRVLVPRTGFPGVPRGPQEVDPPEKAPPAKAPAAPDQELQRIIERLKELRVKEQVDRDRLEKLAAEIQALAERLGAEKKP
jgi:hypothetical protein